MAGPLPEVRGALREAGRHPRSLSPSRLFTHMPQLPTVRFCKALLVGGAGDDVIYGGDGNDFIDSSGVGQRDKLYCGEGRDGYAADKLDYVDSSCEVKQRMVGSA